MMRPRCDFPREVPPELTLLGLVPRLRAAPAIGDQDRAQLRIGGDDLDPSREAVVLEPAEQLLQDRLKAHPGVLAAVLRKERDREPRPHQRPSVRSTSLTCWIPVW